MLAARMTPGRIGRRWRITGRRRAAVAPCAGIRGGNVKAQVRDAQALSISLKWKMGFEIELMAPPDRSRWDLARLAADRHSGAVERFFHPQSEPSQVKGLTSFENLTPGFRALAPDGSILAAYVDDLTLQDGLDKQAAAMPGWYRIVADDARILRLVIRHCDPQAALDSVLEPLAGLFGTAAQPQGHGMVRVVDDSGASVALGAPLPGERHRPCEIVTAPIASEHAATLDALLADARSLGFTIPLEGATHIHFDAARLCCAHAVASLVALFSRFGGALRALVGVNPNCVRLGPWPEGLAELTQSAAFPAMAWPDARGALGKLPLSKYCDFNLLNLVAANPEKHTFEVRVLPSFLDAGPILEAAALFEALLDWCCQPAARRTPLAANLPKMIGSLPMDKRLRALWQERAGAEFRRNADR